MAIGIQMPTGLVQRSTVNYLDQTRFRWMNVVASDIESDIDHIGSHLPVCALSTLHQIRSHLSRLADKDKRSRHPPSNRKPKCAPRGSMLLRKAK